MKPIMAKFIRLAPGLCSVVTAVALGPPSCRAESLVIESALVTLIEQVEVPARAEGVLARILVREGQVVREGEVLAQIDDAAAQLQCGRARIELQNAQRLATNDVRVRLATKAVEVAKTELQRAKDSQVRFKKSVSDTELDRLRLQADRADLEQEQAKLDFESAQLAVHLRENETQVAEQAVERCRLVAPIDGVVVQLLKRKGEWVEPGKLTVRILRTDRLRAECFIDQQQTAGLVVGRRATLQVQVGAGGEQSFSGELTFICPEINPVNGQVRIWADIENSDGILRPGLQAKLTIHD